MRDIGAVLTLTLLAGGAWPSSGTEEPPPTTLALDQAIRAGLAHNPDLAALRADASAGGAARRSAESSRWPVVFTEAGWRRSNNQVVVFSDKLTAGEFTAADFGLDSLNHPDSLSHDLLAFGVEIPIDVSGGLSRQVAAARDQEAAAAAQVRAAEVDLVARITEAYHSIVVADAALAVSERAVENARKHEGVAVARAEAGAALKSDPLRARAARLDRERDLMRRKADAELARTRLCVLMGAGQQGPAADSIAAGRIATGRIETEPIASPLEEVGDLEGWLATAVEDRADLDAARRGTEAAAAAARSARSAKGPQMGAAARYELNANGFDGAEDSYLLGLSLRWNAFDGGRSARIEEADAGAAAASARLRSRQQAVRLEVESAWRDARVADEALIAAREGAAASEEARRISAERYASGLLPLTDLLDAETAALSSRQAEIGSLYDAAVARVRLRRSAGRLVVPR